MKTYSFIKIVERDVKQIKNFLVKEDAIEYLKKDFKKEFDKEWATNDEEWDGYSFDDGDVGINEDFTFAYINDTDIGNIDMYVIPSMVKTKQ